MQDIKSQMPYSYRQVKLSRAPSCPQLASIPQQELAELLHNYTFSVGRHFDITINFKKLYFVFVVGETLT